MPLTKGSPDFWRLLTTKWGESLGIRHSLLIRGSPVIPLSFRHISVTAKVDNSYGTITTH
jgi:hypothetical protein